MVESVRLGALHISGYDGHDSNALYTAWHVGHNHWSRGCQENAADASGSKEILQFHGTKEIDIRLDCDHGTMRIQLMDAQNTKYPELTCSGMPTLTKTGKDFKGYVPHFNIHGGGTEMRLAKIPVQAYGVRTVDIFAGN